MKQIYKPPKKWSENSKKPKTWREQLKELKQFITTKK